jgi:glycine dehydrogenase
VQVNQTALPSDVAEARADFAARHIGPSEEDQRAMLAALGYASLDDLMAAALPAYARPPGSLAALPPPRTEQEALTDLRRLAARNTVAVSMIGLGYYAAITPAVIRRNVLENPAWYTAYTPYQPEISQGRLEALLNFQTMVCDLTGLDVANASLLDEASAAAEAMTLARRVAGTGGAGTGGAGGEKRQIFLADADCLPQTLDVLGTRADPLGIELRVASVTARTDFGGVFGVLLQYPGASGEIRDLAPVIEAAHAAGATVAVAADILALTLLRPPGELGADIALGSTQRFGVPMFYGGPHAAYLAVRGDLRRQLPGRLVGVSVDADGRPAFRLALQAREQHIRREKATSNICTAQVLLAVVASMYACYHGPDGLTAIARRVHRHAMTLAATLKDYGLLTRAGTTFDTIGIELPGPTEARAALLRAREAGYNLCDAGNGVVQVSCDETTTPEHLRDVVAALVGASMVGSGLDAADVRLSVADEDAIPASLARTSKFLTHPTFSAHRSETAMLRYLRRLSDLDVALDRSMIPLGSCTMKLNATAEMEAITWPEFAGLHPLAPAADTGGYAELIGDLERWLCAVTGYDACSLQPNAGSAGELAGLLAIRAYHRSRGDRVDGEALLDNTGRDVCLIPASAHGTNAASAVLAGMRVAVVRCGADGAIDLGDLRARLAAHEGRVAAIMVTYPSTNGVYEETITAVADLVHEAGGQVYIDGANLNALAGVASPALLGGDVSHLNLHKTFCIPHGGGGPGVGPVAAKAHLAPFLPARIGQHRAGPVPFIQVAGAPQGSAGILPISWAYIAMMGADGLRRATQVAVLSANYIARRLAPYFPVVYAGRDGLVAHECVVDLRRLPGGITVEDVAKRLIDYGFHAPTMSFPVAGTFMIEPTESESLAELDAFCDALIAVRAEMDKVASGEWDAADNPLKNAPHTAEMLIAGEWAHAYGREAGGYPGGFGARSVPGQGGPGNGRAKYWPPVRRIDQAYGDRHLVCACQPPQAFEQAPSE